MNRLSIFSTLVCASLGSGVAPAAPTLPDDGITLAQILDDNGPYNGNFSIGGLDFSIVSYFSTTVPASTIEVVPVMLGGDVGFDIQGEIVDTPGDEFATGFTLQYHVNSDSPLQAAGLAFNGFALGDAIAQINESFFDDNNRLVDSLNVFADGNIPMEDWVLQAMADLKNLTSLNVIKDLALLAEEDGQATTSFIRQTFTIIPMPAPFAMAAVGLAGVVIPRRRRSREI